MEKLNKLIFNGEEYLPKKVLLKWIREISDAVNSFSDRADPIRAQGANKVISLLLEKIEPPQEHWKPSKEQLNYLSAAVIDAKIRNDESTSGFPRYHALKEIYEELLKL